MPEFLQSVNNGSSSLSEFNLENEEFGPNFNLDFSSLVSSSLLSLGHFQPELPQPLQDITSSSNQTASCPDLVDGTRFPVVPQEEINEICEGGSSKNTARTREFHKSQETVDCKAKQLRRQGKGKRPNKAQAYTETEEEVFWSHGTLGDHNGTALTNVNFKNLTEIMGMRGRQDHYDAYVEDFSISCQADGSKVVEFKENPTKTRQGGLRNPTRHSPQQMWSTDGGERDPVRLFEEWLSHRPEALKNSGPLYLTIIPRPITATWYFWARQIMKSVASCLPPECKKKITNHSARKKVVAKLKKAGQPRHKFSDL